MYFVPISSDLPDAAAAFIMKPIAFELAVPEALTLPPPPEVLWRGVESVVPAIALLVFLTVVLVVVGVCWSRCWPCLLGQWSSSPLLTCSVRPCRARACLLTRVYGVVPGFLVGAGSRHPSLCTWTRTGHLKRKPLGSHSRHPASRAWLR